MRTVTIAALLAAVTTTAAAQASIDTSRTIVSATGVARQAMMPDRATLVLLVEPQAMSLEEAGSRLAAVERAVMDTLRRLGIPASAIQVYNNGVSPYRNQMAPTSVGGPTFAGRELIRIELTRLDQAGAVSTAALARGATFVVPPTYQISAQDSVRRALIPRAFEQAKSDAEVMARAAGGRLGRLVDFSANQLPNFADQVQQTFYANNQYDNGQRSVPTALVSVTVTTRWLLLR